MANTYFGLLAEFGTADIELTRVCGKFFGLCDSEAKRRASLNRLPLPVYRTGSQKSQWLVSAIDLAAYIDNARAEAQREWEKMNSPTVRWPRSRD